MSATTGCKAILVCSRHRCSSCALLWFLLLGLPCGIRRENNDENDSDVEAEGVAELDRYLGENVRVANTTAYDWHLQTSSALSLAEAQCVFDEWRTDLERRAQTLHRDNVSLGEIAVSLLEVGTSESREGGLPFARLARGVADALNPSMSVMACLRLGIHVEGALFTVSLLGSMRINTGTTCIRWDVATEFMISWGFTVFGLGLTFSVGIKGSVELEELPCDRAPLADYCRFKDLIWSEAQKMLASGSAKCQPNGLFESFTAFAKHFSTSLGARFNKQPGFKKAEDVRKQVTEGYKVYPPIVAAPPTDPVTARTQLLLVSSCVLAESLTASSDLRSLDSYCKLKVGSQAQGFGEWFSPWVRGQAIPQWGEDNDDRFGYWLEATAQAVDIEATMLGWNFFNSPATLGKHQARVDVNDIPPCNSYGEPQKNRAAGVRPQGTFWLPLTTRRPTDPTTAYPSANTKGQQRASGDKGLLTIQLCFQPLPSKPLVTYDLAYLPPNGKWGIPPLERSDKLIAPLEALFAGFESFSGKLPDYASSMEARLEMQRSDDFKSFKEPDIDYARSDGRYLARWLRREARVDASQNSANDDNTDCQTTMPPPTTNPCTARSSEGDPCGGIQFAQCTGQPRRCECGAGYCWDGRKCEELDVEAVLERDETPSHRVSDTSYIKSLANSASKMPSSAMAKVVRMKQMYYKIPCASTPGTSDQRVAHFGAALQLGLAAKSTQAERRDFLAQYIVSAGNLFVRSVADIQAMWNIYFADDPDWRGECRLTKPAHQLWYEFPEDWSVQDSLKVRPLQSGSYLTRRTSSQSVMDKAKNFEEDKMNPWCRWPWASKSMKQYQRVLFTARDPPNGLANYYRSSPSNSRSTMFAQFFCELLDVEKVFRSRNSEKRQKLSKLLAEYFKKCQLKSYAHFKRGKSLHFGATCNQLRWNKASESYVTWKKLDCERATLHSVFVLLFPDAVQGMLYFHDKIREPLEDALRCVGYISKDMRYSPEKGDTAARMEGVCNPEQAVSARQVEFMQDKVNDVINVLQAWFDYVKRDGPSTLDTEYAKAYKRGFHYDMLEGFRNMFYYDEYLGGLAFEKGTLDEVRAMFTGDLTKLAEKTERAMFERNFRSHEWDPTMFPAPVSYKVVASLFMEAGTSVRDVCAVLPSESKDVQGAVAFSVLGDVWMSGFKQYDVCGQAEVQMGRRVGVNFGVCKEVFKVDDERFQRWRIDMGLRSVWLDKDSSKEAAKDGSAAGASNRFTGMYSQLTQMFNGVAPDGLVKNAISSAWSGLDPTDVSQTPASIGSGVSKVLAWKLAIYLLRNREALLQKFKDVKEKDSSKDDGFKDFAKDLINEVIMNPTEIDAAEPESATLDQQIRATLKAKRDKWMESMKPLQLNRFNDVRVGMTFEKDFGSRGSWKPSISVTYSKVFEASLSFAIPGAVDVSGRCATAITLDFSRLFSELFVAFRTALSKHSGRTESLYKSCMECLSQIKPKVWTYTPATGGTGWADFMLTPREPCPDNVDDDGEPMSTEDAAAKAKRGYLQGWSLPWPSSSSPAPSTGLNITTSSRPLPAPRRIVPAACSDAAYCVSDVSFCHTVVQQIRSTPQTI